MKKLLLLLLLVSFSGLAQTINNYKYVIVPLKYNFLKKENQYRLNTITKMLLNEKGFVAFYENEQIPGEVDKDRCNFLYVTVESDGGMLSTKLFVTFKDCQNKLIYSSGIGSSRKKEFETAYHEALKKAFESIQYSYEGGLTLSPQIKVAPKAVEAPVESQPAAKAIVIKPTGKLKAEAISSGYLLIDESSSMIVLRLTKTSDPKTFIAQRQNTQGVLIQKEDGWYFEHSQNGSLVSEKINVSF